MRALKLEPALKEAEENLRRLAPSLSGGKMGGDETPAALYRRGSTSSLGPGHFPKAVVRR